MGETAALFTAHSSFGFFGVTFGVTFGDIRGLIGFFPVPGVVSGKCYMDEGSLETNSLEGAMFVSKKS